MKTLLPFLLLFSLQSLAAFAAQEGKTAPDVHGLFLDGKHYSTAAMKGHVVLVHFWATFCDNCQQEMPVFDAYYKKHHTDGLEVIAISLDDLKDEAKVRATMAQYSFPASFAKDAEFKKLDRIWRLPMTFVIDRNGVLQKEDWHLDHLLTAADFEKTITPLLK